MTHHYTHQGNQMLTTQGKSHTTVLTLTTCKYMMCLLKPHIRDPGYDMSPMYTNWLYQESIAE